MPVIPLKLWKTVAFSGAGDDLVHISGSLGADQLHPDRENGEWNVAKLQSARSPYSGSWEIRSSEGAVRVHALYDGCWSFAVGLVDEGEELPVWSVEYRLSESRDYSTTLTITVPADAVIVGPEELRRS